MYKRRIAIGVFKTLFTFVSVIVSLKQMSEQLFNEGEPKVTAVNLQRNLFYYAGLLMAQSIIQGGPTPNFLTANAFNQVVGSFAGSSTTKVAVSEMPEAFRNDCVIKKVSFAKLYIKRPSRSALDS